MKRQARLRPQLLNTDLLNKVSGGRGTYCGNVLHCDQCGNTWEPDVFEVCTGYICNEPQYSDRDTSKFCPNCYSGT